MWLLRYSVDDLHGIVLQSMGKRDREICDNGRHKYERKMLEKNLVELTHLFTNSPKSSILILIALTPKLSPTTHKYGDSTFYSMLCNAEAVGNDSEDQITLSAVVPLIDIYIVTRFGGLVRRMKGMWHWAQR